MAKSEKRGDDASGYLSYGASAILICIVLYLLRGQIDLTLAGSGLLVFGMGTAIYLVKRSRRRKARAALLEKADPQA